MIISNRINENKEFSMFFKNGSGNFEPLMGYLKTNDRITEILDINLDQIFRKLNLPCYLTRCLKSSKDIETIVKNIQSFAPLKNRELLILFSFDNWVTGHIEKQILPQDSERFLESFL